MSSKQKDGFVKTDTTLVAQRLADQRGERLRAVVSKGPFAEPDQSDSTMLTFEAWLNRPKNGQALSALIVRYDYDAVCNAVYRYSLQTAKESLEIDLARKLMRAIRTNFGDGEEGIKKFVRWALLTCTENVLVPLSELKYDKVALVLKQQPPLKADLGAADAAD